MNPTLKKHLSTVAREENRILSKTHSKGGAITKKIEAQISDGVRSALQKAFQKAFQFVFEKGNGIIEKSMNKIELDFSYDVNNYALGKQISAKTLGAFDKQASKSKLLNSGITTAEGATLGLFGVGLPDIPVFISIILKGIYETALSYGFSYDTDQERYFILSLIHCSMLQGELQLRVNGNVDGIMTEIAANKNFPVDLQKQLHITADTLANEMLTAKFVQGLPIVGVVGSVTNLVTYRKILGYAGVKYKKRFLLAKAGGV